MEVLLSLSRKNPGTPPLGIRATTRPGGARAVVPPDLTVAGKAAEREETADWRFVSDETPAAV